MHEEEWIVLQSGDVQGPSGIMFPGDTMRSYANTVESDVPVRVVALIDGFTNKQFGSYDRQTHAITFDETYHLTQSEQEDYTQLAASTDKARVIVPLHL